jgi:primosomal protein N' (replication factor Y) (superfamily II helicase)
VKSDRSYRDSQFSFSLVAEPSENYHTKSSPPSSQQRWVEVLVDVPGVQGLYTYSLPEDLTVQPGDILSVPFGMQITGGIAIRLLASPPTDLEPKRIRDVEDVISVGFFPDDYWQLLQKVAEYYLTDLMSAIRVALPPGLLGRSQKRIRLCLDKIPLGAETFCTPAAREILQLLQQQKEGNYSVNYLRSQIKGATRGIRELSKRHWIESYLEAPQTVSAKLKPAVILVTESWLDKLTPKQTEILQMLRNNGGEMWKKELIKEAKTTPATLNRIVDLGYITLEEREILRKEQGIAQQPDFPKQLSLDQAKALAVINSQTGYAQILLHGVTGSGKTEVYLQAIASILAQGKSALVLVPEIGLTPQLTDRFRARFGSQVCVYHSKLSDGERYDTWRQTIQGEPQIIIGTRSAIFAPLPNLGLIVLDEEHDSSFKQNSPIPTYHARTVANWRAELNNCPLILGSATPSLESLVSCQGAEEQGSGRVEGAEGAREQRSRGAEELQVQSTINNQQSTSNEPPHVVVYTTSHQPTTHYLSLPERIGSRPLPPVEIVDLREELNRGNKSIFSLSLQNAIADMQARQQQAILFIPRRGHSTFVSCRSCGFVMECPHCDVSLSYHYTHEGAAKLLRCHYCNYTSVQPDTCPQCCSPYLKFFGSGTQKVTQELSKLYPDLKVIRFDSDTTKKKNAHRELIGQFTAKEADILVGTQMLTKGLDIAGVTLVGVVSADGLLHRSDYRAAERAFQTLTQVAGRAGRGDEAGKVIIQTYSPEHPVIRAVKNHDYTTFSNTELEQRQILSYPPYGNLILIRLSSTEESAVEKTANAIANICLDLLNESWSILGPAPASIMKVARRYRWQILLKNTRIDSYNLPDLSILKEHCSPLVSMTIDVDPINID